MLAAIRASWLVMLLVALAYLSAFWSPAPDLVLRRATTLAVTTVFAVYLAARFEMGPLVAILVKVNAFAVVASFVVMAVVPNLAHDTSVDYPNALRGAYAAKNTLGGVSALGIIVAFYAWRRGHGPRLLAAALIPANLVLLYLSESATARVIVLAGIYAAMTASAFRRRDWVGLVFGFVLVVIGTAVLGMLMIFWADVLAHLGRGANLTGRLPIWRLSIHFIEQQPWLGDGFGAFWRPGSVEAGTFWSALHWQVPHAHNAWLEIGLELGGVGIAGITLLWLAALRRVVRLLAAPAARHLPFCLAVLGAILVENLTEFEFLRPDSFYWVFFVTAFTYLGQECARYRRASPADRRSPAPAPAPAVAMPRSAVR
jgi:O-antigen ligase